jgi:hypothetical protein
LEVCQKTGHSLDKDFDPIGEDFEPMGMGTGEDFDPMDWV